jgi:hypothetical protein
MASTEQKISKLGAAVTRHITLTITAILELVRKPGSATSQSVIMAVYNTGLLTIYGIKKHAPPIRSWGCTGAVGLMG